MVRFVALVISLAIAIHPPRRRRRKAIRFGKLWDGTKVTTDALVVVTGDRITAVGKGNGAVPAGAEVIDLRKYTGIPGLIDLHTHITYYWDRQPGTRPRGRSACPPSRSISRRTTRAARSRPASRPFAISMPATTWISRCES